MIYVKDFLLEYNINFKESGKNVAATDINVDCPWCGAELHLGIMRETGILLCWVCNLEGVKYRTFLSYIMKSERIDYLEAKNLLAAFSDDEEAEYYSQDEDQEEIPTKVFLPKHSYSFWNSKKYSRQTEKAYKYLSDRKFDSSTIDKHGLKYCVAGSFAYRIIVPIYFRRQLVNYLGRDYTGKQQRYDNCKRKDAIVRASNLLYGWDAFVSSKSKHCRIVEGVFDSFRFGKTSVGLLKSKLSLQQKALLKAAQIESCSLFLDRDAHGKSYEIGEELEPFIPKIKVILMKDEKDVAEHSLNYLYKLEQETPFNSF